MEAVHAGHFQIYKNNDWQRLGFAVGINSGALQIGDSFFSASAGPDRRRDALLVEVKTKQFNFFCAVVNYKDWPGAFHIVSPPSQPVLRRSGKPKPEGLSRSSKLL